MEVQSSFWERSKLDFLSPQITNCYYDIFTAKKRQTQLLPRVYPKAQTSVCEQTEFKQMKSHGIVLEIPSTLKFVFLYLTDEAGSRAATGATRSFSITQTIHFF